MEIKILNNLRSLLLCLFVFWILIIIFPCCSRHDNHTINIIADRTDFHEWEKLFSFTNPVYLEDSTNSHLGYSRQCFEDNNKIIFVDYNSKKIFCFSNEGKYLFCIGQIGHAKNEYTDIRDVAIDNINHHLIVLDHKGFIKYDTSTGQFVGRDEAPSESLDYWSFIPTTSESYIVHKIRGEFSIEECDGKGIKKLRKSTVQQYGSNHFYNYKHKIMIIGDYGDLYIDEYCGKHLVKKYRLDICGHNLPSGMKPNDIYTMNDLSNSRYFTCILSAYETEKWLYCLLKGPENNKYHLFYNKSTGETKIGLKDKNDGIVIVGSDNKSFKALFYPDLAEIDSYSWNIIPDIKKDYHNPVYLSLCINEQEN